MSEATLSKVSEFLSQLGVLLSKASGLGFWLFILGFALLALLAMVLVVKLIISLIRILPNLTVGQFVKFVLVLGALLMVLGLFMP